MLINAPVNSVFVRYWNNSDRQDGMCTMMLKLVCVQNNEWDWYGSGVEWRNSIDLKRIK